MVCDPRAVKYRSASDRAPTRAATAVATNKFALIPDCAAYRIAASLRSSGSRNRIFVLLMF
jgi:hypothetical protein